MWDVKEPTPLFEKSSGRRPRWCGQPLRDVGLGSDGTLWHLAWDLSPVRAHSLWAVLCPEKRVKKSNDDVTKYVFRFSTSSPPFVMEKSADS